MILKPTGQRTPQESSRALHGRAEGEPGGRRRPLQPPPAHCHTAPSPTGQKPPNTLCERDGQTESRTRAQSPPKALRCLAVARTGARFERSVPSRHLALLRAVAPHRLPSTPSQAPPSPRPGHAHPAFTSTAEEENVTTLTCARGRAVFSAEVQEPHVRSLQEKRNTSLEHHWARNTSSGGGSSEKDLELMVRPPQRPSRGSARQLPCQPRRQASRCRGGT